MTTVGNGVLSKEKFNEKFSKLLNEHYDELLEKNVPKQERIYTTARKLLNMQYNKNYIIHDLMINYDNNNETYKAMNDNKKRLISAAKNVGLSIIGQKDTSLITNAEAIYNNLNINEDFEHFFKKYGITWKDIYNYGKELSGYMTTSDREHAHDLSDEDELIELQDELEEERKKNKQKEEELASKDRKIARRDRRIEKYINKMADKDKEIQKIQEDNAKKLEEINNKYADEYKRKVNKLNKKYEEELKTAKQNKNNEEIAKLNEEYEENIKMLKAENAKKLSEAIEKQKEIAAEAYEQRTEEIAQIKHKMEERHEKDKEALLEEAQRNQKEIYGFAPNLEAYIKTKLAAKAYSLDEDDLIDKIARDIGKPGGLPKGTDPKRVAKAIYDRGAEETLKHIKKIANLAILTGYNNDLYNKLPGDVAQEVQKYITDKINDDIRKKNIKYILPKDKPRWEYAMQNKQLNPMLGRSAWRVN